MSVQMRNDGEIQRDVLEELKWDMRVHPNECREEGGGGGRLVSARDH